MYTSRTKMFLVRGNIRKWLSSKFVRASEPVNLLFFFFRYNRQIYNTFCAELGWKAYSESTTKGSSADRTLSEFYVGLLVWEKLTFYLCNRCQDGVYHCGEFQMPNSLMLPPIRYAGNVFAMDWLICGDQLLLRRFSGELTEWHLLASSAILFLCGGSGCGKSNEDFRPAAAYS